MSEREELEAEIAAIEQAWLFSEDAVDTAGRRRHLATALLSSGYTKGNGELVEAVREYLENFDVVEDLTDADPTIGEVMDAAAAVKSARSRLDAALASLPVQSPTQEDNSHE